MQFKKWSPWWILVLIAVLVVAILLTPPKEMEETTKETVRAEQDTQVVEKEVSIEKVEQEPEVVEEEVVVPEKNRLTKDAIENMFKRDPEEKVYEDSTFITKNEGVLTADYIMYVGDETIPYLSAIFYGGDLADIQLETELSNEEIEEFFGITFSEETREGIVRKFASVEINFDERFADENIKVYPFELD